MKTINIDTSLLRSFVTIVDVGTFALAAKEVCRTQSALSQQMEKLESELAVELFRRIGRNKVVTNEGMKIYDLAKKMLEMNDAILQQASISSKLTTL
ncbi:HTH transcriptional regulator [Erwinia phage AH04]|uniref:HTH transcriptional regulator n=1 Tax=Erwinia phage AH04 TaxID=2869569 RepID=A0AAE8BQ55_9CAUD|nr:HTH transcriptional regulator [Erwinia phage AH04]QZA70678.1 HTH transcriptional regulator [Erwinia phage AH04]